MSAQKNFSTIGGIIAQARQTLTPDVWDYLMGGAGSEATLRRNDLALDRIALLPAMMRDVREATINTSLLGLPMALPVFPAPIGSLDLFDPEGSAASVKAAGAAGTLCCVGLLCHPDFTTVTAHRAGPLMLQLYIRGDLEWLKDVVSRAENAGYDALVLTADSAIYARRDRDLANGYAARRAVDRVSAIGPQDAQARRYQAGLDWQMFEQLREMTRLPIILKGVMRPSEAVQAIEMGADAIYVSNHGGRQLDHAPAAIEQLPHITRVVDGRIPVIVDGGFMRGADVVKAIACGASAVAIGKLQGLALASGGADALAQCLDLLGREIADTLRLVGCTSLQELDATCLVEGSPSRHQLEI